jgi:rsbT co-antagonist protein RsbR
VHLFRIDANYRKCTSALARVASNPLVLAPVSGAIVVHFPAFISAREASMNASSLNDFSGPDTLCELYGITETDLDTIREFAAQVQDEMPRVISEWYEWLRTQPEYEIFFPDDNTLARVKGMQGSYWEVFMEARIDEAYLDRRRRVGETHARIGLPLNTYFAGMNKFLELLSNIAIEREDNGDARFALSAALAKQMHLDTAIVVDTYNQMVEDTLTAQSKSLLEMSTPVTHIWDGILLLPIVGIIDSKRARDVMNATLEKIAESQARIFILDISGVGVVDTAVANHLIKISRATRLMGCECVISGVSPSIAQTIVDLGIDVGDVKTTSTMKDALATAFKQLGMEIVAIG